MKHILRKENCVLFGVLFCNIILILISESSYRAFAHDVIAIMLVFQFKIILIRIFCLEHQHGRHGFC
jgi:hypothetical protein